MTMILFLFLQVVYSRGAPVITWQLGNSTHVELGRLLQPVLTQASNHLEQILEIPPETLFAAVAAVQDWWDMLGGSDMERLRPCFCDDCSAF